MRKPLRQAHCGKLSLLMPFASAAFSFRSLRRELFKANTAALNSKVSLNVKKRLGELTLIFPIIYIEIPELKDEKYWRGDPVLRCIGQRQYVDWSDHRFELDTPRFRRETALFARTIVHALKRETERLVSDVEERRPRRGLHSHKIALDTDELLRDPLPRRRPKRK